MTEMPVEIRVAPDRESINSGDWVHGEWWVGPGGTRYYRHDAAQDARIAELEAALRECADDLAAEIGARYPPGTRSTYPVEQRRYERDMEPVDRARAVLVGKP